MLITSTAKVFEKPVSGVYNGVLADVVYTKDEQTNFGLKNKTRLVWLLEAKDKEGAHFQVIKKMNSSMFPKSDLGKFIKTMLGSDPGLSFDPDTLIGKNYTLMISLDTNAQTGKVFANVTGIVLNTTGTFAIPATFERDFVKKARQAAQGQGQQQSAQLQQVAPAQMAPVAATGTVTGPTAAAPVQQVADEEIPF